VTTITMRFFTKFFLMMLSSYTSFASYYKARGTRIGLRKLERHNAGPEEDNVYSPPVLPYTDAPSSIPSVNPTILPTMKPSMLPSTAPSTNPTDLPSSIPSSDPSAYPTKVPSLHPSAYPTKVPSVHPSGYPTALPSFVPSSFPTLSPECFPDSEGIYGSSTDSQIVVKFGYELETSSGDVQNEIIPSLEKGFSENILPELFSGKCSSQPDRFRHRKLATIGVSSKPSDTILPDVSCEVKTSEDNACAVVRGELTIYIDGDGEDIEQRVVNNLKEEMTKGSFVSVHKGIERVSYVDLETRENSINSGEGVNIESDLSSGSAVIYGIIAGVVVGIIGLALLAWRLKKKAKGDDNSNFEKSGDELEAKEPPVQGEGEDEDGHKINDVGE